jgi:hypothetical protein
MDTNKNERSLIEKSSITLNLFLICVKFMNYILLLVLHILLIKTSLENINLINIDLLFKNKTSSAQRLS